MRHKGRSGCLPRRLEAAAADGAGLTRHWGGGRREREYPKTDGGTKEAEKRCERKNVAEKRSECKVSSEQEKNATTSPQAISPMKK